MISVCCFQCLTCWGKWEEPPWPCTPSSCACWSCVLCPLPPASSSPSTTASATPMRPTWGPWASTSAAPSAVGGKTHIQKTEKKDIKYWIFWLSLSGCHSLFVCPGAHRICPARDLHQHGGGDCEGLHPGIAHRPEEQVGKNAAGLLPGHPLCAFVSSHHRGDLHVRPRHLHTQEGAAEAHRGCTQGDHDVLVTLERAETSRTDRNLVLQLH